MGHKISEAIIEDYRVTYVDTPLPSGKIKAHIIYDVAGKMAGKTELNKIIKQTAGIYRNKNIDADSESKKMRASWDRNA